MLYIYIYNYTRLKIFLISYKGFCFDKLDNLTADSVSIKCCLTIIVVKVKKFLLFVFNK